MVKDTHYWMIAAAAAAGVATLAPAPAQAQELCSIYRVVPGDTLGEIARDAGVRGGFQTLFNANRNILRSPNIIEVGDRLSIPCADGSLPSTTQASVVREARPAPVTQTPDRPVRIATASGYAPFTDEDEPGGGMITRMVNRAMELGNPDQDYDLMFVNDWGSHLDTLLPSGAVDMVFPWFRPDCDQVANLSPASASRCTDFNHSEPLYEVLIGYYTIAGGTYENATDHSQLQGARLCRPEAWYTFDLEAVQLMPPNVELTQPVAQNGCWELLMNDEIDIITLEVLAAEEDYRNLGLDEQVSKLEPLTTAATMHIFVSKDNQFANEALPIINAGVEELRLSGEWFDIVREGVRNTIEN